MLQKRIESVFYPGGEWFYVRLYMGPASADRWICSRLPLINSELKERNPEALLFFVRYANPEFHIRVRIQLSGTDPYPLMDLIYKYSGDYLASDVLWKIEIGTYVREMERYSGERIQLFEKAFDLDSSFWLSTLPLFCEDVLYERIRWQLALFSMTGYCRIFSEELQLWKSIVDSCIEGLEKEIQPDKEFIHQVNNKFRKNRAELQQIVSGDHPVCRGALVSFTERNDRLLSLFSDSFEEGGCLSHTLSGQQIADLIHMSLNRGLRSKHRLQEYVLYRYLRKLLATQGTFE